jgi:hypothetical protein
MQGAPDRAHWVIMAAMSGFRPLLIVLALPLGSGLLATGCSSSDDGPIAPVDCPALELSWSHPFVATTPGVTRTAYLAFSRDSNCVDAQVMLSASERGVVSFDRVVTFPRGESRILVEITGVAEGAATLTATWALTSGDQTASLDAYVSDGSLPTCDGSASGSLNHGGVLEVGSGSLAGTHVALPEGAARMDEYHVPAFSGTIGCAGNQVPAGYVALGPAVTIGPEHLRFHREIPVRIPVDLARLPEGTHWGHLQVSYTGPGVSAPRIVPFASMEVQGTPGTTWLAFQTRRLGTFQAVAVEEAPAPRPREYSFQGITGVSMGAGGSALIGLRNPHEFDLVAPMGGPVEWIYLLDYIRTFHLGGFCTWEERDADPTGCEAGASTDRTPPARWMHEHRQDFEHWHYEDEYGGQGGTFDRRQYIRIFRDLTHMYGNANTTHSADPTVPNITPPGIDPDRVAMSDVQRCNDPVIIPGCVLTGEMTPMDCPDGAGYFDDEYNPDGSHQVITFCDGGEIRIDSVRDVGVWDPDGVHDMPVEVMLAVDINPNGVREPGEPVMRSGREPFDDCGLDGVCNPDEPGYDPATNPDPNGDDYDPAFNPGGTEGNALRDSVDGNPCSAGEAFLDVGLDSVLGTRQVDDGGFDFGEGNGCWDVAQGTARMLEMNPRSMVASMPPANLRDVDVFTDGGIRDLFNFGVVHEHFIGSFAARGQSVALYNSHISLPGSVHPFSAGPVRWEEVGKYAMLRYGDPDATEQQKRDGDGGHVGTAQQLLERVFAVLGWMSARWPDGDRDLTSDQACPGCETSYVVDFTSSQGRTGPVGIVLPPGYHSPENADRRYPIAYFLHGYGQEPQDLVQIGFILRDRMSNPNHPRHARLQKMILVFPDGRCRGDECLRGTFYADAPEANAAAPRMESWVLELMEHMQAEYRVKPAATFEVVE